MRDAICAECRETFPAARSTARFCSVRCRVAHHRAVHAAPALAAPRPPGVFPRVLTDRDQWVRWREVGDRNRRTKKPLTLAGHLAAVNRPDTWTSYRKARASTLGDGLGFVMTRHDDISCIDLDDVLTPNGPHPALAEFIAGVENVFLIEVSPSGTGIHVWHHGPVSPGTKRIENGMKVERYSWGRYVTITGTPYTP